MRLCVKCRRNQANVPEPCCGAPDCEDIIYLECSECEAAEYEADMAEAQEWADQYYYEES